MSQDYVVLLLCSSLPVLTKKCASILQSCYSAPACYSGHRVGQYSAVLQLSSILPALTQSGPVFCSLATLFQPASPDTECACIFAVLLLCSGVPVLTQSVHVLCSLATLPQPASPDTECASIMQSCYSAPVASFDTKCASILQYC